VETATIGIKTADRKFYQVLREQGSRKKRVVLTTVHEGQTSAQIDLYRGQGDSFEQPEYVGSLLLEDIDPQIKGEPDIQLLLELDEDGNLSASAKELRSGSYQSLSLQLESLSQNDVYDIPDFEIGELDDEFDAEQDENLGDDLTDDNLTDIDFAASEIGAFDDLDVDTGLDEDQEDSFGGLDSEDEQVDAVPSPALLVGFVVLALAMLGILSYFVFRALEAPATPPLEVEAFLPLLFARRTVCRF
jgi:hypothetical protein